MNWPKSLCFLLAFCFGGILLQAKPATAAKDAWISVRSKNFTLIGNAAEKDIRNVGARLEQFREAVSRVFTQPARRFAPPINVVVFKDKESYAPFKPLYQGKPSEVSGYFQSSSEAVYITLAADWRAGDPYAVIFHEYVHFLTSDASLPAWLSEGLAEYYSSFEVASGGKRITVGRAVPVRIRQLREGKWLPLETVLTVNHDSPQYHDLDAKSLFYAQSWALTHYLMTGKRRPQLRQFIAALATGQMPEAAFSQAFQMDVATLELELKTYVQRGNYAPQQIAFEQRIEFDQTMQTVLLSEAKTLAALGDLSWQIHRDAEGEALLKQALTLEPQLAAANSSLGLLRMRQERYGEARLLLRQAIDGNSANYLVYYNYALAWQREQTDSSGFISHFSPDAIVGMRASLHRARELAPEFADTYKTLAFINVVLQENFDEAEALLKRALELEPKRDDFAYTLAQTYLRQQKFAAARQVAERLAAAGKQADTRERAKFLLGMIAKREEDFARAKTEEAVRERERQIAQNEKRDDPTKPPGKRFEGDQVRGLLTKIECQDAAIVLTVVSGARVFRFRAELGKLTFVRHTPEIPTQLTCGAMVPARKVIVTYRAGGNTKLKFDGEPVGVEFLKTGAD